MHTLLSSRLEAIHTLFGQIPDTLKDVWVQLAENNEAKARELIERTAETQNPFDAKYSRVEDADWETCATVLNGFSAGEPTSTLAVRSEDGWRAPPRSPSRSHGRPPLAGVPRFEPEAAASKQIPCCRTLGRIWSIPNRMVCNGRRGREGWSYISRGSDPRVPIAVSARPPPTEVRGGGDAARLWMTRHFSV